MSEEFIEHRATDLDSRAEIAVASARAGAEVAVELFRTAVEVEHKSGKTDVVTRADRRAQNAVVDRIRSYDTDATVIGEENDAAQAVPGSGTVWIVDPIDGTNNFVRGNRNWATSVACLVDGEPVAAANILPALGDSYLGTPEGVTLNGDLVSVSTRSDPDRFAVVPTIWWGLDRREEYAAVLEAIVTRFGDLRRIGSAQASLSLLAGGTYEGVFTTVGAPAWDTVAGAALVRWAGGTVTDLDGSAWHHDTPGLVASNGRAHDELLAAAREATTTER
ncbi:MAG: archaeal fructose-1,6-bisphosphatase related enzymes of inositol monophosphatase family [halophilic archaeon J07HX64]|jgi:Archaeal fructose-1,6-bisphosphatase and related enzymes of inositol monophosphatase family|nr:MAG: archaeal fructose-1,6-bisphosphatase related enzymes of inositol monophosphatase family [halophilic archaeon J07HX64]